MPDDGIGRLPNSESSVSLHPLGTASADSHGHTAIHATDQSAVGPGDTQQEAHRTSTCGARLLGSGADLQHMLPITISDRDRDAPIW